MELEIRHRRHITKTRKAKRKASTRRNRRRLRRQKIRGLAPKAKSARATLKKVIYKKRKYTGANADINITEEFGLENHENIQYFLDTAEQLLRFNGKRLRINLRECPRVWPSGITLLCGLSKWFELTARGGVNISSGIPKDERVEEYLFHCGFYDFVGRAGAERHVSSTFEAKEIVKIQRKKNRNFSEECEEGIVKLLEKYSLLGKNGVEWFNSVVLTETFNNVIEHGVSRRDNGWWVLAQRHPKHGFISLCVADNGIGIRNSLTTGPQSADILGEIENLPTKDGEFIELAIKRNVSGALLASTKEGLMFKKYPRGARRGHGLKLIVEKCKELNVQFSLLSCNGYFILKNIEQAEISNSRSGKIFPGTFYHFLIPATMEAQ